jgi:predicted amidohydrolase YtcJ
MKLPNPISHIAAILLIPLTISCSIQSRQADLILTNATIWTGNEIQPRAQAMAILGDSILAIGTNEKIEAYRGKNTTLIDADLKFVVPGFIDSHVHLMTGGYNLTSVQLRDAKTPEEFAKIIFEYSKTVPKGTWILGGDWDGKGWAELPSKDLIDKFTPDHPVFVIRLDGHMGLANSLAMKLSGVDNNVKDIPGGYIGRNNSKELTGIFKDLAMDLINSKIPNPSNEQLDKSLDNAMEHFARNGVTSVHHVWDVIDYPGFPEAIERAYREKRLLARVYELGELAKWRERQTRIQTFGKGDKWLKINGLKTFVDGSLGSQTAAFKDSYKGSKENGLLLVEPSKLYEWISQADKVQLQLAIHAIGDRAINMLLNNYEKVASTNGGRDRRFRIEHAQHINSADIPRFAKLNVVASMQPYHAIDDGRWAEEVIGSERINDMYIFRSLMDAGAKVSFGSDWPVAPVSPLLGIYAAVTRRTIDDKNPDGWVPKEKTTVEQALRAYTINGAYASSDEKIKGTLAPGKLADFVILSENLLEVDPIKIKDVKVLQTFVGGNKVYDAKE